MRELPPFTPVDRLPEDGRRFNAGGPGRYDWKTLGEALAQSFPGQWVRMDATSEVRSQLRLVRLWCPDAQTEIRQGRLYVKVDR
jgi:hypothetical protein